MFQAQIQQANDMANRLENGTLVQIAEHESWFNICIHGIEYAFGKNSSEWKRWALVRKNQDAEGAIDYIGYARACRQYSKLLQEFDTIIGMRNSIPRPVANPTVKPTVKPPDRVIFLPSQKANYQW
ncbi:hypothetical protein BH10CHL1_BH10CHL1_04760 [soil metagenome]